MNAPQRSELEELIRNIIAQQLKVAPPVVLPGHDLARDLGADLLSRSELALAFEMLFEIEIPDAEWIDLESVSDVVEYVSKLVVDACQRNDEGSKSTALRMSILSPQRTRH